ncbi:hypothetical protein [Xanthomonas arboricola]|uniref:hypothetical protein n=1 Tax=Xanthomonas arboricola TaxID=56448 RepID=UPI0016BC8BCB|nr:hypothetical protein [Xanthomonas arboricola]MBB4709618.1 hypothetical protein [Xanthomonas arboricola]
MAGTQTNNFRADSSASAGAYGCIGGVAPAPRQAANRTRWCFRLSFFPYQANSVRLAMTDHVRRSRVPFPRFAAGLLLSVGLCAGQAKAQVITHDPVTLESMIAEYGKDFERWKETLSQYQKEYAHYQQQLIKLQSLNFGITNMEDNFTERDPNYGMAAACSGAGSGLGSIMTSIKSMLPNMDGNLVTEQTKICQLMVMTENARYNESVRMLKRLIQRNKEFDQKIQSQRKGVGTSQGALAANDNEVARFVAQNSMDLDYWQAKLKAYDYYEASLKSDQRKLTKRAFDGNKEGGIPLVTQLVQAAALKAALSVD